MVWIANVENAQACIHPSASEHGRIVLTVYSASFGAVIRNYAAGIWRIIEHQRTIGGDAYFQHDFGDDFRVRLIADVDDIRITSRGRPPGTCGPQPPGTPGAAGLVCADDVRAALNLYGQHLLRLSLVVPEQLADNPDLWIGATELIVADVLDHQPVWTDIAAGVAEIAGLPRVHPRPFGHTGLEARRVEL